MNVKIISIVPTILFMRYENQLIVSLTWLGAHFNLYFHVAD